MKYPLVTILAISYNQEKYVWGTLDSINNQTYKNIQLIIADDGSTDGTKQIIREWINTNRPGTLFIDHQYNLGLTKNLNSARQFIEGSYYQFVGCEDLMMPEKIAEQVNYLEQLQDVDIIYSDMCLMDTEGKVEEKSHYEKTTDEIPLSGMIYDKIIAKCFISTPTALMRIKVLNELNGYNEKLDIDDFDFWIRASQKFKFFYYPGKTMTYREMPNSLSKRKGIFSYRNRFLAYYFNYNGAMPYRNIFNSRLLFCVKNLVHEKYKYSSVYAFKTFLKTGSLKCVYLGIRSFPFLFLNEK